MAYASPVATRVHVWRPVLSVALLVAGVVVVIVSPDGGLAFRAALVTSLGLLAVALVVIKGWLRAIRLR